MPGRRRSAAAGRLLVLALLALMGSSCDKMPLTAPSNSTITLYAARLAVGLNGAVDVTATVIESAGTPVQNGTVVVFTTTLGSIDPVEARTNAGSVTVKFNSGVQSGTAEIRATSGGNYSATDALKISVGAAAVGKVELLANPTALAASGGSVELTAMVSDLSGNRLGGVPVSFTTDNGIFGQTSVTTDANGEARTVLTTTAKAIVGASVVGGTSGTVKSDSLTIPVRVGPTVSITVPSASLVPGVPGVFSVTVTAGGAAVRTASLNFGDGGSQSVGTSGTSSASHTYSKGGTFIVTATATDTAGESTTATASVSVQDVFVTISAFTVTPASPTASAVADFAVTASSSSSSAPIERYEWNFGDGSTTTTYGSSFTSHVYAQAKRYTVSVRVMTTTGAAASATREIVVQ